MDYQKLNKLPLYLGLGESQVSYSLHYWVNDGLMVLFFFLLGLEIKYECVAGRLSQWREASLVIAMAIGGMVLPALLYTLVIAATGVGIYQGWGIPMATDAAFALGILLMLGSKAPRSAAVCLSALAIVDDMGAVAVISIFYTEQIHVQGLINAGIVLLTLMFFNLIGVRKPLPYFLAGLALWWFILQSGVHATTAGILCALFVPTRAYTTPRWFYQNLVRLIRKSQPPVSHNDSIIDHPRQHQLVEETERIAQASSAPVLRWMHFFERPVAFAILPIFAFLNAGVTLPDDTAAAFSSPLVLAIVLGLVAGKTIGVTFFTWLALKTGIAKLPYDMRFIHIVALGSLAGVGFTMSLFISTLAFGADSAWLVQAKMGILLGSFIAAIVGIALFMLFPREEKEAG